MNKKTWNKKLVPVPIWHLSEDLTFKLHQNYSNPWYTGLQRRASALVGKFPTQGSGSISQNNINLLSQALLGREKPLSWRDLCLCESGKQLRQNCLKMLTCLDKSV